MTGDHGMSVSPGKRLKSCAALKMMRRIFKLFKKNKEGSEFEERFAKYKHRLWYREVEHSDEDWLFIDLSKNRMPPEKKNPPQLPSVLNKKEIIIFVLGTCGFIVVAGGLVGLYFLSGQNVGIVVSVAAAVACLVGGGGGQGSARTVTAWHLYG